MNNFISFAVVVFMLSVLSVPLYSLSAFGADNVTSNKSQITEDQFVTYDNSTRGIKIDYPKGWTVIDQFGLGFFSPKKMILTRSEKDYSYPKGLMETSQ